MNDIESRQPLIDFLTRLPHHELYCLWQAIEVAHQHLIYESTEEELLMEQFVTSLWVATRGKDISERQDS